MLQSGLTHSFRIAASKSNLFKKPCTPQSSLPRPIRNIALSASLYDAGLFTHQKNGEPSSGEQLTPQSFQHRALWESLTDEDVNPYRVWGNYFDFCSQYGPEQLSPEIHAMALRRSVPSTKAVREQAVQKLQEGQPMPLPHKWEYRFQTIIRWIHMSGGTPTLDDYHFILEQFAATGHFHGSKSILDELKRLKISATYRTYGLCLQCAAHRLKLPCEEERRSTLITEASQLCLEILESMSNTKIPCTSVNLDLCIRILKESVDVPAFEKFLQIGYGVDLSFPDQPPFKASPPASEADQKDTLNYLPFSTAALNTTIDILGKRRLLSRMVSAFEVLTKPLGSYYGSPSRDFDDDDDWPTFTEDAKIAPPGAEPNTTTYNTLIRHASQSGSFILARHYILEVFDLDQQVSAKLRNDFGNKPAELIQPPRLAINRGTMLPIFGFANRSKHLPLTDWVVRLCAEAISRKEEAISYFSEFSGRIERPSATDSVSEGSAFEDAREEQVHTVPLDSALEGSAFEKASEEVVNMAAPDSSSSLSNSPPPLKGTDALDLDLESQEPYTFYRPFDVNLHLRILERDRRELQRIYDTAKETRERLSARIKERIRRRIWNGKDIYLVSLDERVILPRQSWRSISVPPPEISANPKRQKYGSRTQIGRPVNPYFTPSYGRT